MKQAHHEEMHVGDTAAHGTLGLYVTGFALSVVLTAIPFWLVMTHAINNNYTTMAAVMGLAFIQIIVHMIYFLHMNTKSENGWTAMAMIFTAVLVLITLTGSIWVMHHLDENMKPMSASDMKNMP